MSKGLKIFLAIFCLSIIAILCVGLYKLYPALKSVITGQEYFTKSEMQEISNDAYDKGLGAREEFEERLTAYQTMLDETLVELNQVKRDNLANAEKIAELNATIENYQRLISELERSQVVATFMVNDSVYMLKSCVEDTHLDLAEYVVESDDFVFDGWLVDGVLVTSPYLMSADTTFVADIKEIYDVTFKLYKSDLDYNLTEYVVGTQKVKEGEKVVHPDLSAYDNYYFPCWEIDLENTIITNDMVICGFLYDAGIIYPDDGFSSASYYYWQDLINDGIIVINSDGIIVEYNSNIDTSIFKGSYVLRCPMSVKGIAERVFQSAIEFGSVEFSKYGLETLGYLSFAFNDYISSIDLNSVDLKEISDYAFFECEKLESVILPSGLESIGMCAFQLCRNLKTIIIPDSVNRIGSYAFRDCDSLESIIFEDGTNWYATTNEDFTGGELIDLTASADNVSLFRDNYYLYKWYQS